MASQARMRLWHVRRQTTRPILTRQREKRNSQRNRTMNLLHRSAAVASENSCVGRRESKRAGPALPNLQSASPDPPGSQLYCCCAQLLRALSRVYLDLGTIRDPIPCDEMRASELGSDAGSCHGLLQSWLGMAAWWTGQRLGSMERNDYRYFSCAQNGFNENRSVGAEHESLSSVKWCIVRRKQ